LQFSAAPLSEPEKTLISVDYHLTPKYEFMIDLVKLLAELVSIPSVNPMGRPREGAEPPEARLTDYLERLLNRWGIPAVRQTAEPNRDNLLALIGGPSGDSHRPLILLEAHQDTVPVDGMTIPPFAAEIRQGRLYGRGACDVKGGMAAMLVAVARLHGESPKSMPSILLAFTVNEEYGFTGAQALAKSWRGASHADKTQGVTEGSDSLPRPPKAGSMPQTHARRPDYAIVAEPTELQVVVAHKGVVRWRCRARGRAAHSAVPSAGENAIYRMARALVAIERYAQDLAGTVTSHPLCGPATLSVGTISGGVSVNTVPDACTIEVDRRLVPGEGPQTAQRHLVEYLQRETGLGPVLEHEPPFMVGGALPDDLNGPLAKRLMAAAAEVAVRSTRSGVPYGTDAAAFAAAGVPTVVFGPGCIAQAHTADEWIALEQVEKAAEIYYRFLKSFC